MLEWIGFATLMVVIVMLALAYFEVLDPTRLPEGLVRLLGVTVAGTLAVVAYAVSRLRRR